MKRLLIILVVIGCAISGLRTGFAAIIDTATISKAQEVLSQAAAQQKYTFVLFYKENDVTTQAVAQTLTDGVAKRQDRATLCLVRVTDPAEKTLVDQFGVSRAPMPLTLAIAPNGAVTGIFPRKLVDANLATAFVTPTMMRCMKSLQDGKMILVCVHASSNTMMPTGVREFQADPQFNQRLNVVSMQTADPAEALFLKQMQIDPAQVAGTTTVFLAPPNVLVGKFDVSASKAQIAAALHKAGKCCDDPNCKHNHAAPSAQVTPSNGRQANQNPNSQRN